MTLRFDVLENVEVAVPLVEAGYLDGHLVGRDRRLHFENFAHRRCLD